MLVVPILLVAGVAAYGPAQQSPSLNQTGARPQNIAGVPAIDQLSLAQPASIARAQEEEAPAAETESAEDVPVGDAPEGDVPVAEDPAMTPDEQPAISEGPAQDPQPAVSEAPAPVPDTQPAISEAPTPVPTAEPAAAAPTNTPAPVAGAPTPSPTVDLSRILEEPAIQTAVAQFSNMAPSLPAIATPSGQQPVGVQPAAQTALVATITAPK
jgi:hypothetical protein